MFNIGINSSTYPSNYINIYLILLTHDEAEFNISLNT